VLERGCGEIGGGTCPGGRECQLDGRNKSCINVELT
jgi:hypothetical protein